jgi:hypothetical protein
VSASCLVPFQAPFIPVSLTPTGTKGPGTPGPGRDGGLVSDVWIQGAFPSRQSNDSLNSLAKSGLFPEDLAKYLDVNHKFPAGRLLFEHQSMSIRAASQTLQSGKPSIVVTAGTGAGKTESFLLPILSRPMGSTTQAGRQRNAMAARIAVRSLRYSDPETAIKARRSPAPYWTNVTMLCAGKE